jgi:Protein of unknown function (DUF2971)
MHSNQPKKVYRYQSLGAKAIESLCHDELHFADPAAFNDPFDCKPTLKCDSDNQTLRSILKELIKRRVLAETLAAFENARIKGDKAEAHAEKLGEQSAIGELKNIAYHATNPEYECSAEEAESWLLTSDIQRELLIQYDKGVCCFSSVFNNPLLWSHYGDQHKGICVGYSVDRILKPQLHKVVYGGDRTIKTSLVAIALLENDDEAKQILDRDVLLRKAPSWRYEREWRLLGNRGSQESVLELMDITFGIRCSDALKHVLVRALESQEKSVNFFEMYELRERFNMKRRYVNVDELQHYFPRRAQSGEEMFGEF